MTFTDCSPPFLSPREDFEVLRTTEYLAFILPFISFLKYLSCWGPELLLNLSSGVLWTEKLIPCFRSTPKAFQRIYNKKQDSNSDPLILNPQNVQRTSLYNNAYLFGSVGFCGLWGEHWQVLKHFLFSNLHSFHCSPTSSSSLLPTPPRKMGSHWYLPAKGKLSCSLTQSLANWPSYLCLILSWELGSQWWTKYDSHW